MGTGLICWKPRKQSIAATSTADVGLLGSATAIGDLLWLRELVAGICRYSSSADLGPTVYFNGNHLLCQHSLMEVFAYTLDMLG